ncbi:MAG: hypothetical protein JRJ66_14390 [Deltaproteobacteria bacterium]|nr:hypothetical protein [Deltaproteobacteria bacterium]
MKKLPRVLIITFLLTALSSCASVPLVLEPEPIISKHFEIYAEKGVSKERIEEILQYCERASSRLDKDFAFTPSNKIKIYVYASRSSMQKGLRDFSGFSYERARYYETHETRIPWIQDYKMHLPPRSDIKAVTGLYAHFIIEELNKEAFNFAAWLGHGLPIYYAFKISAQDNIKAYSDVKCLIQSQKFIELRKLSSISNWRSASKKNMGFIFSESFVASEYFIRRYGVERAVDVLKLVSSSKPLDKVFKETLGASVKDFEEEMKTSIKEKDILLGRVLKNSLVEQFSSTELNADYWEPFNTWGSVGRETGSGLVLSTRENEKNYGGIRSGFFLVGDFDIQVSFALERWTKKYASFYLNVTNGGLHCEEFSTVAIRRQAGYLTSNDYYGSWVSIRGDSDDYSIKTKDMKGGFRIKRNKGTISTYFKRDGEWILLKEYSAKIEDPLRLHLGIRNWNKKGIFGPSGVKARIKRLEIRVKP